MRMRILLTGCAIAVGLVFASEASAQVPAGNHWLCRKVKDYQFPAKHVPVIGITTSDVVGNDTCETKKAFLFCSPASKNGGPVPDPSLGYCCYKAKCTQKPAVLIDVVDQFNPLQLETKKPFLLCNPCSHIP